MNKWCGSLLFAVALVFLTGSNLQAQDGWGVGGFGITGYAGYFDPSAPDFDNGDVPAFLAEETFRVKGAATYGGRIKYVFKNGIGIEGSFGFSKPNFTSNTTFEDTTVNALIYGANLSYNFQLAQAAQFFLTAGWGAINWDWTKIDPDFSKETDNSLELGGGVTFFFSRMIALRAEVRNYIAFDGMADLRRQLNPTLRMPTNATGIPDQATNNWEYTGGLTLFFGGQADSDGDGVPNNLDRCPDTPKGVAVDANGCPLDGDGDGVPDYLDQCPNTAAGAVVDATGCPVDGDGDGVPDGIDQCPNTPAGATVDARGCPMDSDGDGVYDGVDQCPNTPRGAEVDARGCPVDDDGDGVPNGIDQCPNTPANTEVDAQGCTRIQAGIQAGRMVLQNIFFAFNSAALQEASQAELALIGNTLVARPEVQLEIQGHTDSIGSAAYNLRLSQRRAQAVVDYLLENFSDIESTQLRARGVGEAEPIATNDTDEGRAQNRRVEFLVIGTD